ncbi:MAG: type IV pilus assembly protein PilM [bacterium]|nr:type IV pilus assembly protein PilM [bacterium]
MPILALDIGTYTIKAVHGKGGTKPEIIRAVESFNPHGFVVPSDEAQLEKMVKTLETFLSDNNLPTVDVRLSMPESVVSTKIIPLPPLSDAELASAIGWQAEQHIPIPPEELSLEYHVISRPPKNDRNAQMRVMLIGVRKSIIERYLSIFTNLSIEPTVLETQMLSVIRSLQFTPTDPTTLVVHIGASTMDMAMVFQGQIEFVITHVSGGQVLTRTLEQSIGLDAQQAESYKRTYGMDEAQFQGKVRDVLVPPVRLLIAEFQKAIRFFMSQHPTESVKRVLLSGGTAQLPGIVPFATSELGIEVLVAAPFAEATGELPTTSQTAYTVAMGMLMRDDS